MALANSRYQDGDSVKPLIAGKLQIQSEAAEVFYKDLEIRPIPAMPAEYAGYFKPRPVDNGPRCGGAVYLARVV